MNHIHQITKYFTNQKLELHGLNYLTNSNRLTSQSIESVNKVLTAFFKAHFILISSPVYTILNDTTTITLCYYKSNNKPVTNKYYKLQSQKRKLNKRATRIMLQKMYITKFFENLNAIKNNQQITKQPAYNKLTASKLRFLVLIISKMLNTNVKLEIVRLKYVYHDSTILAQFLGLNSHLTTYGRLKKILKNQVSIQDGPMKRNERSNLYKLIPNTYLTGFKIRISGRLHKQRVVPKQTVKSTYKGYISPSNTNVVEQSTYTGKNKKGAFSIRVYISHGTKE